MTVTRLTPSPEDILKSPLHELTAQACGVRDEAYGRIITYSRKVFIPLTQLCRDVCGYCTFAKAPRLVSAPYLQPHEVLEIARAGASVGCKEALFTLGDKPELRYPAARAALDALGFETTVDYLAHVAGLVLSETGLLPHINAGVLGPADYEKLKPVSASMGLMLESTSARLCARGQPHFGSPDKAAPLRLKSIEAAGLAAIPFTSGLLVGIGETRQERIQDLQLLGRLHAEHGHLQEVIIQNFRPKAGTRMANVAEPDEAELLWTLAAARLLLPPEISVQAPPNLSAGRVEALIGAGLNDFGGVSPVTPDHVNPEAPWPEIEDLEAVCASMGRVLAERLTVYPRYIAGAETWLNRKVRPAVLRLENSAAQAREHDWSPGAAGDAPPTPDDPLGLSSAASPGVLRDRALEQCLALVEAGREPTEPLIQALFEARGAAATDVARAADELRRAVVGDEVTYVVNRNINYTNICTFSCSFCAFSKTSTKHGTRDRPYVLSGEEIGERVREAWAAGATEVCLQGGIHPRFTGRTYLEVCRAVKEACPQIHVHAFSPLEVAQGALTLGRSVADFLRMLKDEGLGSLPGTAAEILDDEVRAQICPDKVSTEQWLSIVSTAHRVGLPTTSTIMFGHLDRPVHWARHLLRLRRLQAETGGVTEFVPLPFVHMQSPIYLRGQARRGPTWRECVLMHAVGRIVLHGLVSNVQSSWVKLGLDGAAAMLDAGANDLGGVLMNESISRAAGAAHGQQADVASISAAAADRGRTARQRTTLYADTQILERMVP